MALRFDDTERTLELSVRDLVEAGAPTGDLVLQTVLSAAARMAAGREAHVDWQADRGLFDGTFQPEVRLRRQMAIGEWTVVLHGRVDGLSEDGGVPVVEEVKSTALDAARLFGTTLSDWPAYVAQLESYLWMVAEERRVTPIGRLVFVSLVDGSRHVLGVPFDEAIAGRIRGRLEEIVRGRERRIAWLHGRRRHSVPVPHEDWRPGQEAIAKATFEALERGAPLLVEAPTGLGKTAAVLHGVLRHALARDRQVFWATARTTQQRVALATLLRFRAAGLPLRIVTVSARERACLNDVIACRPDRCRFAAGYFDKVREHDLVAAVHAADPAPETLMDLGRGAACCPWQLAVDSSVEADVIVGDYNYVFDPGAHLRTLFAEEPGRFVVVVDEAHQLPDRARGYASPRVEMARARLAEEALRARARVAGYDAEDAPFAPYVALCRDIADAVLDAGNLATGPFRDGVGVAELSATPWRDLADRIDEVAIDYARLQASLPPLGADDPWIDVARQVQRLASALETSGEEVVHVVGDEGNGPFVGLLCLDPSRLLGERIASLGGFVASSATLSPPTFYRDMLGLHPDRFEVVRAGSPFPPEHRKVVMAPRVSTAWKDRPAHAPRTAELIQRCVDATPGNVAVYFPSFEMLRDLVGRLSFPDRELLVQERAMPEARRLAWLDRLGQGGARVVLCAVLGGIFAEGIDLPPGALHAVVVVGPALPPVGLERDLLQAWYEQRYGEGFRYASLVPGMTRVVQAAGRLVRRPEDRGVVVLIGRRFRWRDARELLPEEWDVEVADDPVPSVAAFWEGA